MKDQNSKAHDLFLLMFNISQITIHERIVDFFIGALEEIWPQISVRYQLSKKTDDNDFIEISSSDSHYGFLYFDNFSRLENSEKEMLYNAAAMLAVILKKNEQAKLLSSEKLHLQKLVDDKINRIKESEERFRNVFEYSVVGKTITEPDGKFRCNKAFSDMMGYSIEELTKIKWQQITHPDDLERDQKIVDSLFFGEYSSKRWEKRYIHKNGDIVWVDISTILQHNNDQKPLYFITTIIDITERKLSEQLIRVSEERYHSLFENMLNGFAYCQMIFDKGEPVDFIYLDVNIAFESLTGLKNVVGKKVTEVIPGIQESDNNLFEIYGRVALTGKPETFEMNVQSLNDWYSISVYSPKKEFFIAVFDVITERKRVEEALSESEEKFRNAFLTSPDSITITRKDDGMYIDVNNGFTQIFGYSKEEILGKTSLEIKIWQNYDDRKKFIGELKSKGIVENFETKLYSKNRKLIDCLVSAAIIELCGILHIISTTRDITERKHAEEALRESEQKFRRIYQEGPFGMVMVDKESRFIKANPAFCKIIGYTEEEIQNLKFIDITHNDDINTDITNVKKLINGEIPIYKTEKRYIRKDGQVLWASLTATANYDGDGNFLYNLAIIENITPRKNAENEIMKLNESLEQKVIKRTEQLELANKELEAFSYSVSHDLRAPLRHISGYVELLTERFHDSLPEKAKHYFESIAGSAIEMGALIDDLLQFSRTGRQEMQQADLDMNMVLLEAMDEAKKDTKDRSISWSVKELPSVYGDFSMLRMVWVNLLSNAVKYTRSKPEAIIEIGFTKDSREFVFFVRDNGAGFDMKYANKLFGVFQRLHSSDEFEGTGIGLANVRRIISKHGGRTWAEAKVDKGATFYFSLPK
jgi:PAS domain S-box-containing protein